MTVALREPSVSLFHPAVTKMESSVPLELQYPVMRPLEGMTRECPPQTKIRCAPMEAASVQGVFSAGANAAIARAKELGEELQQG